MSRYGTLYHDAKQSLCPPNTSSCLFFEQQIFSKWGKLRGSAMALSQGIWTDGLVSQLTPDRLLSRQHSHECHAWLTYYQGFRNETHLFYLGNLSGWSQREQFESFFHGYGSSCLNQARQRSCCLVQPHFSLPWRCAAPQEQLGVAVLPCDLHCSLCSFHFLADTPELYPQRERRGFHTK